MAATDEWRWTDDQGVQRVVREDELRSALASSVLPPSTLVWREGMAEWLPASSVPELGAADARGEGLNDGTTDVGMPIRAQISGAEEGGGRPMPPLDTGRPTPTELLNEPARGPKNNSGAPRPAAGQPAAGVLKIGAAPRPIVSVPRAAPAKTESPAKLGAARPGAWNPGSTDTGLRSKGPMGKKSDDELTLVADARDPFKLRSPGEGPGGVMAGGTAVVASSDGSKGGGSAGTAAGAGRRPFTQTSLLPDPAAGAASGDAPKVPAKPLPAAGQPARRSVVPPPPVYVGRRSTPPAKPIVPAAGEAKPLRSTAFMGTATPRSGGAAADTQASALAKEDPGSLGKDGYGPPPADPSPLGKPGFGPPNGGRPESVARSAFGITENTSTDSTGVLPLSGKYAADPERGAAAAPPPQAQPAPSAQGAYTPAPRPAAEPAPQPAPSDPRRSGTDAALASYPPAPHLILAAQRALAGRMEPGAAPLASGSQTAPIAGSAAAPGYAPAQPQYSPAPVPYSAIPPTMSLGEPAPGEMRATGAMPLVNPKLRTSMPPPPDSTDSVDIPGDGLPRSAGRVGDPVVVPMSSLFGSGAILIAMAIGAFFVGRCSMNRTAVAAAPARTALAVLPRLARASLPSAPKPCWMAKQPVRWASAVLQTVPVDVAPTDKGVIVAYARDEHEPGTVEVDFSTGSFTDKGADRKDDKILRVFAPHSGVTPLATTDGDKGPLAPFVFAPSATPFVIGMAGRGTPGAAVAAAEKPEGSPATLWPVAPADKDRGLEAARVIASGPSTYAVVFRRAGSILGGFLTGGLKAEGSLGTVNGSGGSVGKPSLGVSHREVAVVFADQKASGAPWEIRAGHAPLGQMPRDTVVVPLPKGGPGGDAFAPDIAGTADGRWVLVWTEGRSSAYAVRAQTLGADFKPLGDPIAISPPAGNYGQAVVGVAGNYVTTMFLSKPKDAKSYELWGAVLQCGP